MRLFHWAVMLLSITHQTSSNFLFVYDWPELQGHYSNHSDKNHVSHGVETPQWQYNFGAGRFVNTSFFEHKTSQFSLFKILHERALIDSKRTLDPKNATSFFIPFDFGMYAAFSESNGKMRRTGCPQAKGLLARLDQSPHFKANYGHDHTLVVSINQNMNYFMAAPKCVEVLLKCWNCTKLCVDEYLFVAKDRAFEMRNKGINWHAGGHSSISL